MNDTFLKACIGDDVDDAPVRLMRQAGAGANALMPCDSNAGMLGPRDYRAINLPCAQRILADLAGTGVLPICFGRGQHETLADIAASGADVIGIDFGKDLRNAVGQLGPAVPVQGNIEPYVFSRRRNDASAGLPKHCPAQPVRAVVFANSATTCPPMRRKRDSRRRSMRCICRAHGKSGRERASRWRPGGR